MSQSDRECVERCLDGHPEAFEQLVERYQASVLSYLTGRLGDVRQAEEATQEALVRSYFALAKLKNPESFLSWLFGIADRVAKEQWRNQRRASEIARTPPPLRQRSTSHDYELQRAVTELAAPYRDVVLLRYFGGMSCAEVAERLGIALGTVTSRLSRAYTMLRGSLARTGLTQQDSEAQP